MKRVVCIIGMLLVAWSLFVPVFEGPDESGHYCHAEYIARNRRLPNFNVRDGCFLPYPPLYYLLLTPAIMVSRDASFTDEQIQENPRYRTNRKDPDVFTKYIHTKEELFFRWNPLQRTVHLVRLISVLLGLGMIWFTYRAARFVHSDRSFPLFSLLLFFNPMFLHMFSVLSNVVLVSFLASLFILLEIRYASRSKPRAASLLQGLVLGFGVLTKINMSSLVLGFFVVSVTSLKRRAELMRDGLFVCLGFLISAGWYIARTLRLYGEPFEITIASSFRGASMTRMQEMGIINYWSSFPDTLFRTFWSGYGLNKVWLPDAIVVGLLLITLFACVGFFFQYHKHPRFVNVCFYYVVAVLVGHVLVNIQTEAFHAKDIFMV